MVDLPRPQPAANGLPGMTARIAGTIKLGSPILV